MRRADEILAKDRKHRDFLNEHYPTMPKDWWPDEVLVIAKCKNAGNDYELAFAITSLEDANSTFSNSIDLLRSCLWDGSHFKEGE